MIRGGITMLAVSEVEAAVRFYIETLGMKLVEEEGGMALLDAGEGFLVGLRKGDRRSETGSVLFRPKVPIDEAIAIYENRGITFTVDRTDARVLAHFQGPDGNQLALIQPS